MISPAHHKTLLRIFDPSFSTLLAADLLTMRRVGIPVPTLAPVIFPLLFHLLRALTMNPSAAARSYVIIDIMLSVPDWGRKAFVGFSKVSFLKLSANVITLERSLIYWHFLRYRRHRCPCPKKKTGSGWINPGNVISKWLFKIPAQCHYCVSRLGWTNTGFWIAWDSWLFIFGCWSLRRVSLHMKWPYHIQYSEESLIRCGGTWEIQV